MTILRERTVWRKPRPANETRRSADLTPDEQANVKAALAFLTKRYGTATKLAVAMGSTLSVVRWSMQRRRSVSAGIALRAARVAGVPLEKVLCGAWPPAGVCQHCGRGP